jgi:glycosyltransferase involved in cell wall biosynthesis
VIASSVSVVIPAYRAAGTLRQAVDSCLQQAEPGNIFVVLDGLDDDIELVRTAAKDVRLITLRERKGAPVCRNVGLELADAEYVLFLDADDYLEAPFLNSAKEAAEAVNADMVFGRFALELPDGSRRSINPSERYGDLNPSTVVKKWLQGQFTPTCALLWRSSFVRALGGWDETLVRNQDGDLVYRALLRDPVLACCTGGQGVYVLHDSPGRISKSLNHRALESQIVVLNKIRNQAADLSSDPSEELSIAYYNLARMAFRIDNEDIGRAAENAARDLGLKGQPGSMKHSIIATALGLRRKERLTQFFKQLIGVQQAAFEYPGGR